MKKTIYFTQQELWRDEAAGRRLKRASGGEGGRAPCWWETAAPAGKVVDLTAWKAENLVDLDGSEAGEAPESGLAAYAGRKLRRRPRERRQAALALAELAATLSAAGVMAALILRVLVF